ncbi:MAG: ChaN family lipoprotein [Paracoccaceae bacterium]
MYARLLLPAIFAVSAAVCAPLAAAPCAPALGAICAGGKAISADEMLARLRAADIAILGERHDNPAHHEWQAKLTSALAPGGLAFEMVPRAKEYAANMARLAGSDLSEALDWAGSGWPDWAMYAPIFAAAPDARIAGGAPARDALRRAVGEGAKAAFGGDAARYGLDRPLDGDILAAMVEEQNHAHCGALPEAMLPGMVEAQRLRDAAFADAALRLLEAGRAPVVLITGNGHARIDRGAPLYLGRAAPRAKVVSVGMIEIGDEGERGEGAPYDIVIHTAAHDRGDPCATLIQNRSKP